ncbi:YdcF family protein [Photobacterium sp. TY1-4]|uniref:YdcF family protein n=1 Tax=Photobacterium sp. TY1-4 TaxID=2899122 RepID=UPI0021BFBD8A|nr:YdcF family protein [Photobacterium sp. TY1-4]UXI03789.1 YdcF family protein [Photobacterium sp. TY1-4]
MAVHATHHDLLQRALSAYQHPDRNNVPLHQRRVSNLEAAIYFLKQAHQQQPTHVDTLLTLATMHTFQGDIDTALARYRQCLAHCQSPEEQRRVLTYLITWHHYEQDNTLTAHYFSRLRQHDCSYAEFLDRFITQIEAVLSQPLVTSPKPQAESPTYRTPCRSTTHHEADHALVTLGYKLQPGGALAPALIARLALTKTLAQRFPASSILVTGGMPQQGKTEARQMKLWLCEQGIDEQRIIEEPLATNTIENARFSLAQLQQRNIRAVTVISSEAHVQRTQLLFQILQLTANQPTISVNHCVVAAEQPIDDRHSAQIKRNCYIDALRAIGLPAFDCPPYVCL